MPEILMKDGKVAQKGDYEASETVQQMVTEAEEKGKTEALKDVPTKEQVLQELTPEDVKELEPVKQIVADIEGGHHKERDKVIESLTAEEAEKLPEAVVQKIVEAKGTVTGTARTFLESVVNAAKAGGKGTVADDDEPKKSLNRRMREESAALSL